MARIKNVKNLFSLLKCVSFNDQATFYASRNGLKVVVEESKCQQAGAFMGSDVFEEYELREELVCLRVDLNVFVECLGILDTPAGSSSIGSSYGEPLKLVMVDDELITECSVKTMEACETLHFSLPSDEAFNKIIADGPQFRELFNDLDPASDYVDIFMSPDPPYFRVTTRSSSCKCQVSVAKGADMIEEFRCTSPATTRYKYSQIKPSLKPLQMSSKVSLQTDEGGLLCFQFMVRTDTKQLCYIEYFCTPVIIDEYE
ncbi:hypothetical protein AAG570_006877 [Ranatra chinensis]|uniref:Cell cycle checkpoint protein RAD1 n=1 Tax=Ranatra chinensis TaxID=642074 RepID=A0ABD0YVK3_9HEMI